MNLKLKSKLKTPTIVGFSMKKSSSLDFTLFIDVLEDVSRPANSLNLLNKDLNGFKREKL